MLSRICDHLSYLGLCNFISKDATDSFAFGMDLQHNPSCFGSVHREEPMQDIDHELHGSVVVMDQNNLVKGRPFELGRRLLDDQARSFPPSFNITHEWSVYRARLCGLQDMSTAASVQGRLRHSFWGIYTPLSAGCRATLSLYFSKEKQMLERASAVPV